MGEDCTLKGRGENPPGPDRLRPRAPKYGEVDKTPANVIPRCATCGSHTTSELLFLPDKTCPDPRQAAVVRGENVSRGFCAVDACCLAVSVARRAPRRRGALSLRLAALLRSPLEKETWDDTSPQMRVLLCRVPWRR